MTGHRRSFPERNVLYVREDLAYFSKTVLNHILHPSQQNGFTRESPAAELIHLQFRPSSNRKHLAHDKKKNPSTHVVPFWSDAEFSLIIFLS